MPSPFPGMDPYLEHPATWRGVHLETIAALRDALQPLVRPRYYVAVEVRVDEIGPEQFELIGIPDATIIGTLGGRDPRGHTNGPAPNGGGASGTRAARVVLAQLPQTVPIRQGYLVVRARET